MQRPPLPKKLCLNVYTKKSTQHSDCDKSNPQGYTGNINSPKFRSQVYNKHEESVSSLPNMPCKGVSRKSLETKPRPKIHQSPYDIKKTFHDVIYQKQQACLNSDKLNVEKTQSTKSLHTRSPKDFAEKPRMNNYKTQSGQKSQVQETGPLGMCLSQIKGKKNVTSPQIKSRQVQPLKKLPLNEMSYKKIRKINGRRYIILAKVDENKLFCVELACTQNSQQYSIRIPMEQSTKLLKECFNGSIENLVDNIIIDDDRHVCYLKHQKPRRTVLRSRLPLINQTAEQFEESFKCVRRTNTNFFHSEHIKETDLSGQQIYFEDQQTTLKEQQKTS